MEHIKGYSFSQGFLSPYFAESGQINYQGNAYVYLSDSVIESQSELIPVMEFAAKVRRLVIVVAPDFKADALTSMVVNHLNGKVQMCAVKLPIIDQQGILSILYDISAYTGATVVTENLGMSMQQTDPV